MAVTAVDEFSELRKRRGADPSLLAHVRDLVVVASSSRGGSTMVGELLRQAPGTVHLRAESNPLFTVAADDLAVAAAELSLDLGRPAPDEGDDVVDTLVWRLLAQWPGLVASDARTWVLDALAEVPFTDHQRFHVRLLQRARGDEPRIDPWYYDLPEAVIRRAFPGLRRPEGPPSDDVIEMPPFTLARPWARATIDELRSQPVVLTTPRNAFRFGELQHLFPNARIRVVHLTRNPAAAINGLIDGWHHRGFFSGQVDADLDIGGYSDVHPTWGRRWWNFDRWPGWQEWTDQPLALVCARQWAAPHEATLAACVDQALDRWVVAFEDLVASAAARHRRFAELAEWLDVESVSTLADVRLGPVMATAPPAPRRWSRRASTLLPAIAQVRELAAELGYADPRTWR